MNLAFTTQLTYTLEEQLNWGNINNLTNMFFYCGGYLTYIFFFKFNYFLKLIVVGAQLHSVMKHDLVVHKHISVKNYVRSHYPQIATSVNRNSESVYQFT